MYSLDFNTVYASEALLRKGHVIKRTLQPIWLIPPWMWWGDSSFFPWPFVIHYV